MTRKGSGVRIPHGPPSVRALTGVLTGSLTAPAARSVFHERSPQLGRAAAILSLREQVVGGRVQAVEHTHFWAARVRESFAKITGASSSSVREGLGAFVGSSACWTK